MFLEGMQPSIGTSQIFMHLCGCAAVGHVSLCKMARTNTQHYTYHIAWHHNTNTNTIATTATKVWFKFFCLRSSGYLLASMWHFCHTLYTIFLSFLRYGCWCCPRSCMRHCSEPKFVRDFLHCNISSAPQE